MASKPKTAPLPSLAAIADEYGQLSKEYAIAIAPFEMKLKRIDALKKALQLACPAKKTEEWNVEGARFAVRLSPCANASSIDYKKLLAKIPVKLFMKFATCTLTALKKHVSSDVMGEVVTTAATGPRTLSTVEKGSLAT